MDNENRVGSIDTMRCIAAFLVVFLHVSTPMPYYFGEALGDIARIAVPFFFLCSGFFIYATDKTEFHRKIDKSIKKTAKLLIYFTVLYFFVNTICWLDIRQPKEELQLLISWDFWFFNITPFCPVAWYLMAYIYSLLFIKLILFISRTKSVFFKLCYILLPVGLCYWLITGSYQFFFFNTSLWHYSHCWITAYPFVMLGIIVKNYQKTIQEINVKTYILYCLIIIFSITSVFVHFCIKKITDSSVIGSGYISTVLLVLVIFVYLLKNKRWGVGTVWNIIGNKYSLYIYLLHVPVNYILCRLFLVKFDFQHYFSFEPVIKLPFSYFWIINSFTVFFISAIIARSIQQKSRKVTSG
jgi:peptidoglycan/LPS O-acetylase OafA/YrhL